MIVDPDFCDHWKTRMLVGLLEGDEAAPVYVLRLWAHCQNRRQSTFNDLTAEALKSLCRFPGHSNKLDASLATSGFIRRKGKILIVENWDRYNASLIAAWGNGGKGGQKRNTRIPDTYKQADQSMTSTQWYVRRKEVIARDGLVCQYCQSDLESCVIDHILPVSRGGNNNIGNLCVSCRECNTSKQDRTLDEWTPKNPTDRVFVGGAVGGAVGARVDRIREEKKGKEKKRRTRPPPATEIDLAKIPIDLHEKFADWLVYKDGRGESYSEIGLKNLIGQVRNECEKIGWQRVNEKMTRAMANGWKGWDFDDRGGSSSQKTFEQQKRENTKAAAEGFLAGNGSPDLFKIGSQAK